MMKLTNDEIRELIREPIFAPRYLTPCVKLNEVLDYRRRMSCMPQKALAFGLGLAIVATMLIADSGLAGKVYNQVIPKNDQGMSWTDWKKHETTIYKNNLGTENWTEEQRRHIMGDR